MIGALVIAQATVATRPVTFRYLAPVAKSVTVAGSFNGWNKGANPMRRDASGQWTLVKSIPYGSHRYKFVIDDAQWVTDPKAIRQEDDGNGNINSVLLVTPQDYAAPAIKGDGKITRSALTHKSPTGADYDQGKLTLRLTTRVGDIANVVLHYKTQGAEVCRDLPLTREASDELYDYWSVDLPWNRKGGLRYAFHLKDGKGENQFGGGKLGYGPEAWYRLNGAAFQPFTTPKWVSDAVVYQIFPDRFRNGSTANDPKDLESWESGTPKYSNRFGGDAVGIQEKIPYLSGLGVSAIYLNPVFKAPSNHRYDASDYRLIDPEIGTNAEFARMTSTLRENGIRTVLDIVVNHTATDHPWFLDLREKGAASRYRDYYYPKSFPIKVQENPNYEAWFGFPSMPKVNVMHPEVTREFLNLFGWWRKSFPGVEGFRLDVANEVDPRFWRKLRASEKSANPQTWIVGEVWGDPTPWLGGDQWDSAMNYPFREANLRFLGQRSIGAKSYLDQLSHITRRVPKASARVQMNLLGSHDTPRWATMVPDRALADLGVIMQFAWPGAPTIYYGDELGMTGGPDPDNRRPMRWDLATDQNPTLKLYRALIAARKASPALRSLETAVLAVGGGDDAFAIRRGRGPQAAFILLNRGDSPRTLTVPLPPSREVVTGRIFPASSKISIPAKTGYVLVPRSSRTATSPSLVSYTNP